MTELVRPWRGVSAEERRSERRSRLLDSCLNVVGAGGVAATTIDRVCSDAKLTKRYFYESFADLDALLLAAADELFSTVRSRMETELARHRSRRDRTHAVLTVLIDSLSGDPRLARLYVECPGHPVLRQRREEEITTFTDFIATAVLTDEPAPDAARLLATRVLVAGTTDVVTSWLAGAIEADRETLIGVLERLGSAV